MSRNNKRLTNEIVDKRLINDNKPITRVGDYINAHVKIKWECKNCKNTWIAIPNSILKVNPSGCPCCAGSIKYTNQDIDNKLKSRNIVRIGNYMNYDTPIKWKCVYCKHEWKASPNGVIGEHKSNCPSCTRILSGKKKSLGQKQRVMKILESKDIKLVSNYTRIIDKHNFHCKKCNHVWSVHLNDIVNNNTGCPLCAGLIKLTNEVVDQRLSQRNDIIYRIDDIVNARTKCRWRCVYGHKWLAIPDSILNFGTGCPFCNKKGFYNEAYKQLNPNDMNLVANLYVVRFIHKSTGESFIKIGITKNRISKRFASYKKLYDVKTLHISKLFLGDCIDLENYIIYRMRNYQYIPEGKFNGRTECFIDIPEVEREIFKLLE